MQSGRVPLVESADAIKQKFYQLRTSTGYKNLAMPHQRTTEISTTKLVKSCRSMIFAKTGGMNVLPEFTFLSQGKKRLSIKCNQTGVLEGGTNERTMF